MKRLKRVLRLLRGVIPQRNPIGRTELELFTTAVLELYNIPNLGSYRSALAAMILQDKRLYRSKLSFALAIRKAQANETAYQIMQEIRKQEKETAQLTGDGNVKSLQDNKV